jgi:hypothetical protein
MMVVARNAFVGSVSSKNFVVQNGIAKLKMSQQEEFLATK